MSAEQKTMNYDHVKATAVSAAIRLALNELIRQKVVTVIESAVYTGYMLGHLLAMAGFQREPGATFDPMEQGYVDGTQALAQQQAKKGLSQ